MSNYAVQIEKLSKEYRIGAMQTSYGSLRDLLTDSFTAPFRRMRNLLRGEAYGAAELTESIMALNDITFDVKHGEVVGIIGHNGAGKSTLLKVLSRITDPSSGIVRLNGRVGALLEVGTGFHNELTGRENIFLNGAILGMSRVEIERKFDEMVDFAGVERFIDTPVKFYSSGMRLRLGFAVAAHLEPEILIVDEVLAVGDAEFQKKCLGKMSDVASEGRTVLFVSHNMGAVRNLCTRVVHLNHGQVVNDGDTYSVIESYLSKNIQQDNTLSEMRRAKPDYGEQIRFSKCQLLDPSGQPVETLFLSDKITINVEAEALEDVQNVSVIIGLDAYDSTRIVTVASEQIDLFYNVEAGDSLSVDVNFGDLMLSPGRYQVTLGMRRGKTEALDHLPQCYHFDIIAAARDAQTRDADLWGYIHVNGMWTQNHDRRLAIEEQLT